MSWLISGIYLFMGPLLALSDLFMLLVLIGFVYTFRREYFQREAWNSPAVLLLVIFGLVIVGFIYTPAPWSWSSLHLKKYAKMLYAIALMLLLWRRPIWQKRALNAFVLSMFFILISTWLNIWFVLPWSASKVTGWGVSHHVLYDYIIQNVMMAFFTIYSLTQINWKILNVKNAFWILTTILSAISVSHLSQGRTGLVILVAGIFVWIIFSMGTRKIFIGLTALMLIIAGLIGSSSIMQNRIHEGIEEFSNRDSNPLSSIGHRAYNYKITPKLIAEKPFFGHGTGAYHTEICRFVEKPEWCKIFSWHPHNQFLLFGADHGFAGMLLYAGLIASLFVVAVRSNHSKARIWLATLAVILLVDSLINSPLFSAYESHFFLYMMALLVAINKENTVDELKIKK